MIRSTDPVGVYRERVPIHSYDDYRQDVLRSRRGEADIFWPGIFNHFAVSSGTVSEGKLLPVSREMLRFDRTFALRVGRNYLAAGGDRGVLFGRWLTVPGRVEEDPERPGVWVGEISGLVALSSPSLVRSCYEAVPLEVLFRPNWDDKLDAIVEAALLQDVRAIVMVPSWAVVLFKKLIDRFNSRYGRRVKTVREVWPNLSVFFSGGVALSSYRALLERQIGGGRIDFVESYGASEGFFSFQDRVSAADMLLQTNGGVFMEFVRLEDTATRPRRFTLEEVETGKRYRIIVTTCSGLWSYAMGDVIEFTSVDPHRILVAGRTSEVMDTYGEAVFGSEARSAIERACVLTSSSIRDYHIAPIPLSEERMPGHQWLVEFEVPPVDMGAFGAEIDAYLQAVNRHYVIRREAEAFTAPEVISLPGGTFHEWLRRSRRTVSAQTKVPRMADDRRIADEVLSISRNKT